MKYIVEQKKLESLLDSEVWDLLAEHNAIVAGGAITSLFCSREIMDIDVYFRSERDLVKVLAAIFSIESISDHEIGSFSVHVSGLSQRTIICSNQEQMIQFMTFKYFPDVQDIFDTFDFTVCMGAYDCKTQDFTLHPEFFKHNSQRYLKFNTGTAFPLMSLMRVDKYRQKGYEISKAELLRVIFSCMQLNLNSWEEAKDHIGGMYGYDMSKAFEEDKDFTLVELSEQLSTLQERGTELYTPIGHANKGFWEIAEELFYRPEEILPEPELPVFDDEKYLYKCVQSDGTSYYGSSYGKVDYIVGSIIDVPSGGLFFHSSSKNPYVQDDNWVECELLEGAFSSEYGNQKRVVHGGKVKVIRRFKVNSSRNSWSELQTWMFSKFGNEE